MNIFDELQQQHQQLVTELNANQDNKEYKENKTSKLKDNLKSGLICLLVLAVCIGTFLIFAYADEDVINCILIVVGICTFGWPIITLIALPFVVASQFAKKWWKIIILGIVIVIIAIGLIYSFSTIFDGNSNMEYLDSHRPDRW